MIVKNRQTLEMMHPTIEMMLSATATSPVCNVKPAASQLAKTANSY